MGLALKTYQSDIFNNWIDTEWIDGENGINAITAVDVSDGKLELDTLILAKKVYNMLNRIAISGGTYNDWIETVYTTDYVSRSERWGRQTQLAFVASLVAEEMLSLRITILTDALCWMWDLVRMPVRFARIMRRRTCRY